jgi:2'-5' RNA ligase
MTDELHRSFIAIFPPPEAQDRMERLQRQLRTLEPHSRFVNPMQFHYTLAFLGNLPSSRIARLNDELTSKIRHRPFSLIIRALGCFPTGKSPKVFWLGAGEEENREVIDLARDVRTVCMASGFIPDEKPFMPHVTIARAKGKISGTLIQKMETVTFQPIEFTCSEFRIMKSQLSAAGATYTTLFTIPLT